MRRTRIGLLAAFLALAVTHALAAAPGIGDTAPSFTLPALDGKTFSLAQALGTHKAVVVMFIATKCPYSNGYNARMKEMSEAYRAKGVLFVGINSNKTEPVGEMRAHAKQNSHTFPILKDDQNKVADLYDARKTPEIFVIDPEGKVRYHGRIDENYEDAGRVASPDLKNALEALLSGRPIEKAETKAFGCSIKRV